MKSFAPRSARAIRDEQAMPSMTPMVDVVLVILIFFMAATVIGGREWLLEAADAAEPAMGSGLPAPVFRVVVDGAGLVRGFGSGPVTPDAFASFVAAATANIDKAAVEVAVVPEDTASYEAVVATMEALTQAGIERVGLR